MGVDLELEDELHSLILIDIACTQMDQTVFLISASHKAFTCAFPQSPSFYIQTSTLLESIQTHNPA